MNEINIQFRAHLSENHQLKAADQLISKLKLELGAANAYIEELEELSGAGHNFKDIISDYKQLKKENEKYKAIVDKITARYSEDLTTLNETIAVQEIREKYKRQIASLEEDVARLTRQRDGALNELLKLRE